MTFSVLADTHTISDAGGNWNATNTWDISEVPAAGDDVRASATSGNMTINATTANLNSFDLTGYTASLTLKSGYGLKIFPTSGTVVCKFAGTQAGTTWAIQYLDLEPAAGTTINLTLGGFSIGFIRVGYYADMTGTVQLQDTLTQTTPGAGQYVRGSFYSNGNEIIGGMTVSNTVTMVDITGTTLTGAWLNINTAAGWVATGSSATLSYGNGLGAATIYGCNGTTFGSVTLTGGNQLVAVATGTMYFSELHINNAGQAAGLLLADGNTTYSVSGAITTNGYADNLSIISSGAVHASGTTTMAYTGDGVISMNYLSLTDVLAAQTDTFYAGAHSYDGGGNTNWIFTGPPVPPATDGSIMMFGGD